MPRCGKQLADEWHQNRIDISRAYIHDLFTANIKLRKKKKILENSSHSCSTINRKFVILRYLKK